MVVVALQMLLFGKKRKKSSQNNLLRNFKCKRVKLSQDQAKYNIKIHTHYFCHAFLGSDNEEANTWQVLIWSCQSVTFNLDKMLERSKSPSLRLLAPSLLGSLTKEQMLLPFFLPKS